MNATFGSERSATMRVTKRLGISGVSMRVKATSGPRGVGVLRDEQPAEAGRRPQRAGIAGERSAATMMPPARSPPYASLVRSPALRGWPSPASSPAANGNATPSGTQSPHVAARRPADEPAARFERGLVAAVVLRAPDVLEPGELRVGVDLVEREELPSGRRGDRGALVGGADRIVGAHPAREIAVARNW